MILILHSVAGSFQAQAAPATPPTLQPPSKVLVKRVDWLGQLKRDLTAKECTEKTPFLDCYEQMTVADCKNILGSGVEICGSKAKLPTLIDEQKNAAMFAFKIGDCAGEHYDKIFRSRFIEKAGCNLKGVVK